MRGGQEERRKKEKKRKITVPEGKLCIGIHAMMWLKLVLAKLASICTQARDYIRSQFEI